MSIKSMILEVVNNRGIVLQYTHDFPSDYDEEDIRIEFANVERAVYCIIKNRYTLNPPSPIIDFGDTVIDMTTIISAHVLLTTT